MPALKKKAASERGASITFALLLFLVCAIISSIVIVAATAVGGRASKMAEMDRRYYAVNSAAELLRDVLEDSEVTVVTGTQTVTQVDQYENVVSTDAPVALTPEVTLKYAKEAPVTVSEAEKYLITAAALNLVRNYAAKPDMAQVKPQLDSSVTGDLDVSALAVTITAGIDGESLNLYVSNSGATKGTVYTLKLTFKANLSESTASPVTRGAPTLQEGKYITTLTTRDETTTTVRWKLADIVSTSAASAGGT